MIRKRTPFLSFVVLLSLVAILLPAHSIHAMPMALAPGDQAPDLKGVTFPVESRWVTDWSSHELTLVNFFATWCEPCRHEMPELQLIYEELVDRGFTVVGSFERWEVDRVFSFLEDVPVTYPIIRPDAIVDHLWGGIAVKPTSFLVNSEGRILRKYVGATPAQIEGLFEDIKAVLDGRPMATQVMPEAAVLPELVPGVGATVPVRPEEKP